MELFIPGTGILNIENILLDFNGTIAADGVLIPGVEDIINELSLKFNIHVITADTFGTSESELRNVDCTFIKLGPDNQSVTKLKYLADLGKDITACIGNGRNDRLMIKEAVLGIAVVGAEGVFTETAMVSDIICPDILSALNFFIKPKRLIATLRD